MIAAPAHGNPVPQGDYVPARRSGKLIVTAGMTPLACSNALTAARSVLDDGEAFDAILAMTVYVAAEDGFVAHSRLADFASAFLRQELGPVGACARAAVGVATLPGGAPVEIQLTAAVG